MTQDERWIENYEKAMRFLSELKPERVALFEKLLALADENKHVNQYV